MTFASWARAIPGASSPTHATRAHLESFLRTRDAFMSCAPSRFRFSPVPLDGRPQHDRGVDRGPARAVPDLVAAARAVGDDHGPGLRRPDRGEEPLLADAHRDVVVLRRV